MTTVSIPIGELLPNDGASHSLSTTYENGVMTHWVDDKQVDTTPQPNPNAGPYIVPMNRHARRAAAKRKRAKR